jgi:vacuolar-type H+-ATPase subunit I/STV1
MDARQEKLFDDHAETIKELRGELQFERERNNALREMVNYWESVARAWWREAHRLLHSVDSARQAAVLALARVDRKPPDTWQEKEELPAFEDIVRGRVSGD